MEKVRIRFILPGLVFIVGRDGDGTAPRQARALVAEGDYESVGTYTDGDACNAVEV